MRPRPIYRWKSFWFGLLTLAFMGWASLDSSRYDAYLGWNKFFAYRIFGKSYLGNLPEGFKSLQFERDRVPERIVWDLTYGSWGKSEGKWVAIPDAAVFFPFLLAWIALLGWRWRRQNKAKEMS